MAACEGRVSVKIAVSGRPHVEPTGILTWERLAALGRELRVSRNGTAPEAVLERARDCEIVLTNKTLLGREHVDRLPGIEYIGVLATGYNVVRREGGGGGGGIAVNQRSDVRHRVGRAVGVRAPSELVPPCGRARAEREPRDMVRFHGLLVS